MHYILCVHVSGFYARCHREAERVSRTTPVVVHRKREVFDACERALERGIAVGATLNEAKSLAPDLAAFAYAPECYAAPAKAWHDLCLPYSGRIEVEDPATVYADLGAHPNQSSLALQLKRDLEAVLGPGVWMGVGGTKWIARLTAQRGPATLAEWTDFAARMIHEPHALLAKLPIARLLPVPPEDRRRLEFLGYRTIGDVAELPPDALRRQFGLDALTILATANATLSDPVRPNYPLDALCRTFTPEGAIEDELALERCLGELAARLASELAASEQQGHRMELALEFEPERDLTPRQTISREFVKPLHTVASLRSALALLAGERAERPVLSLRAKLLDLRPLVRRQRDLLGSAAADTRAVGAADTLKSLQTAFGSEAVRAASELAVARRVRVMRAWSDATGWR